MRILFAAGGTGGHLFPALAVAREIVTRVPGTDVLFVGTPSGMESSLVPKAGFDMVYITIYGLRRAPTLSNCLLPFVLLKSIVQSLSVLKRFAPDIVFGTGAYVAGPVVAAARLKGIPTMLHEQNSRPGLTTRLLAKWVTVVMLSFAGSAIYFQRKNNLRVTGNPTRLEPRTDNPAAARIHFGLKPSGSTVLVVGGSHGAHSMNMALLAALPELMSHPLVQVLWQTGQRDGERMETEAGRYGGRVRVVPFIDDMADAYAAADVVLCRAGATTLAEITTTGSPSILVPYPHATAGHQEINARSFLDAGAAEMILDRELSGPKVASVIVGLLDNPARRKALRDRCRELGRPRALDDIIDLICEVHTSTGGSC